MPPPTLNSEEPQMSHAIPRLPLFPTPHKPRNFNDHNSYLERSARELHAELEGRLSAGRTTPIGRDASGGHTVERMTTTARMTTNGPRRGQ